MKTMQSRPRLFSATDWLSYGNDEYRFIRVDFLCERDRTSLQQPWQSLVDEDVLSTTSAEDMENAQLCPVELFTEQEMDAFAQYWAKVEGRSLLISEHHVPLVVTSNQTPVQWFRCDFSNKRSFRCSRSPAYNLQFQVRAFYSEKIGTAPAPSGRVATCMEERVPSNRPSNEIIYKVGWQQCIHAPSCIIHNPLARFKRKWWGV